MGASHHPVIAILASGSGTTAEAFIRASAAGQINAQVGLVICNNPGAGVLDRIKQLNKEFGLNIKSLLINSKTHPATTEKILPGGQTDAEEMEIIDALKSGNYDAVVLMGYMKRIGPKLVHEFGWRPEYTSPYKACMLNTHPGLLPETKGLYGQYVQEHVLEKKLPFGGHTLHIVAEDYDEGPVITEHQVAVQPNDTPGSLFEKVKASEKKYLPLDVDRFIQERINYLEGAA